MSPESGTRSTVLLVRVWLDERGGVRARLLHGGGVEQRTVATAAGIEEILSAVARWLHGFVASR
jgi:hypothetical protein